MQNVYQYKDDLIKGTTVVIFGFDQESRNFAVRLVNQNIQFHYFMPENLIDGSVHRAKYLNRPFISMDEAGSLPGKVSIVAPALSYKKAEKILGQYHMAGSLKEIEIFSPELLSENVILYGAGIQGARQHEKYRKNMNILGFCDGSEKKWKENFCGKPVISPAELAHRENAVVLLASDSWKEIYDYLQHNGIVEDSSIYIDQSLFIARENILLGEEEGKHLVMFGSGEVIAQLTNDSRDGQIVIYGYKNIAEDFVKKMSMLDIAVDRVVKRDAYEEDGSIFSLAYEDGSSNAVYLILDSYNRQTADQIKKLGMDEQRFYWLERYTNFYEFDYKRNYRTLLDPTLGYITNSHNTGVENGFIAYHSDVSTKNGRKAVIVTLGGSTTTAHCMRQKTWSAYLAEKLSAHQIPAVVYCGGNDLYMAQQELMKLIRDVVPLKPDLVISYSGTNNLGFVLLDKYPFIHPFQKEIFDYIVKKEEAQNIPDTYELCNEVYYGRPVKEQFDTYEFWFRHIAMMHAVCESQGIAFYSFQQPNLYSLKGVGSLGVLAALGIVKDDMGRIIYGDDCALERVTEAEHFRKGAKNSEGYDWFCDLTGILDDQENAYYDPYHIYGFANEIIAEQIYKKIEPIVARRQEKADSV